MSLTLPRRPRLRSSLHYLLTLVMLSTGVRTARAQALDPDLWVTDGRVQATVVGDGRLYIGGAFGYVGPRTGGFATLNADVSSPLALQPEVNGSVRAMVSDGEGGWYIGGSFSRVAGVTRGNGAHVRSDGSLSAWDPGTDGPIECLLATPAGIYVGGSFVNCGGEPSPNLALVNRTTATSLHWTPTPDSVVRALATDGTNIFVGGRFANINGVARRGFAVVTPIQTVLPLNLSLNGTSTLFVPDIHALAYSAGKLYLAGVLVSVNGTTRLGAAAINASTGVLTSWNPNVDSRVRALLLARGRVYLAGDFQTVGAATHVGAAAVDTLTGLASAWNPALAVGSNAYTLLDDGALLYVGGRFTSAGGAPARNLIATNENGVVVSNPSTLTNGTVRSLGRSGSRVFVGGFQTSVGGVVRQNAAALSLATGAALPWNPAITNGIVRSIALAPGRVYLGGTFRNVGLTARNYAAAVDTATGLALPWNPSPDSSVRALVANGGVVYVGGHFRNCGGLARKLVCMVDTTTGAGIAAFDCPLGRVNEVATTLMYVNCLTLSGTRLYIGGFFDRVRPVSGTLVRNNACAVNSATGAVAGWNPGLDNVARTIVASPNGLFVGGDFARLTPQGPLTSVMLFDTLGVDQATYQAFADSSVSALLVNGNNLTAAGGFFFVGLSRRDGLGRANWRTGVNDTWVPAPDVRDVQALALDPATNDLIVGGGFEMMGLQRAFGLARFKGTVPGAPSATVTTPAPGSSLELGSTFRIEWTAAAPAPGLQSADVYVSQTGPSGPWRLLAAGITRRNSYDWVLDGSVAPSTNNYVRVDVRDRYGNVASDVTNGAFNAFVNVVTGVQPGPGAQLALRPIAPNPLRTRAPVSFAMPRAAHVQLSVLDVQGRTLAVLADGRFEPGTHEVTLDGSALPPGLCFVRLRADGEERVRRFVNVR